MGKLHEDKIYGIKIRESADDGSDFSNPEADYRIAFLGEDGLWHVKDSAGAVTEPFDAGGALDGDDLPWTIDIDPYLQATATNWATRQANSTSLFGWVMQSSGAQNAVIGWDIVLAAGTWTYEHVTYRETNRGIYSIQFDAVEQGTLDGYATPAAPLHVASVTGIVVAATGKVRLTLKMATKNASSSSYYGAVSAIQLRRTA